MAWALAGELLGQVLARSGLQGRHGCPVRSNGLQDRQLLSGSLQLPCHARKHEVFALLISICILCSGQLRWPVYPFYFACRAEDATIDNPNDSPRPKDRTKMGQPNSSELLVKE